MCGAAVQVLVAGLEVRLVPDTLAVATIVSVPLWTPVYVKTAWPLASVVTTLICGFTPVTVKVTGCPLGALTLCRVAVKVAAVPTVAEITLGAKPSCAAPLVGVKGQDPSALVSF